MRSRSLTLVIAPLLLGTAVTAPATAQPSSAENVRTVSALADSATQSRAMHAGEWLTHAVELTAVIALVFAVQQYRDARHHTSTLREHTEELTRIEQSLSTRYIGLFPDFLPDLARLVRSAQREIIVMCDYPGYGCFSNPDGFRDYSRAIEDKIRDHKEVSLLCLSEDRRDQYHSSQYPYAGSEWVSWRSKPVNAVKLAALLQDYGPASMKAVGAGNLSVDDFRTLMLLANRTVRDQTFKNAAQTHELPRDMPLYFWLVDDREAIFAVPILSGGLTEYGFRTISPDFIAAFRGMRDRYLRPAAAIGDKMPPPNETV